MTDTPCRTVSMWVAGEFSRDISYIEDIEDLVEDHQWQWGGNTVALCALGTKGEFPPVIHYARWPDVEGAYLAWRGVPARSPEPPPSPATGMEVDDTGHTSRTIPAADIAVTQADLLAALLEWLDTGERPTCVEWSTSSP
ncbi:Imm1 family immunity protein [Stackebrandtia albiflava]|nr:Imm1 family immunity protein [Stackebrandtia albiflava]